MTIETPPPIPVAVSEGDPMDLASLEAIVDRRGAGWRAMLPAGPLLPLAVLFLLFFFDEFDSGAFGVLAPNIKRAFHLSDQRYGSIVVLNAAVVLLLAIPVGHAGDRRRRVPLVVVGAMLAGVFSFLTGVVGSLTLLVLVRIGNGVGRLVNDPVHTSLLSDYYPPHERAGVFSIHRLAVQLGAIIGAIVAGVVAAGFGWRAAFVILIVPIGVTAVVAAVKLHEPRRGSSDDDAAAVEVEQDDPVPFAEARRTLGAVRTLRRQFTGWGIIGAGTMPLAIYLPLYYDRVFHVSDAGRGVLVAVNNAATLAGVAVGGYLTKRWLERGPGEPLRQSSLAGPFIALVLVAYALAPSLWVAVPVSMLGAFAVGVAGPSFLTVQSLVSPARVRSLSFSYGSLYLLLGGFAFFFSPLGGVSDHHGIRWGIAIAAPFFLVGGLVLRSAARFVAGDAAAGLRSMAVAAEMRRRRLSAQDTALLVCAGVDVAYDNVQVLFEVDLEVGDGELVALLGTNGAGKSTLLKAISGLVDPIGGAILFDGRDITHMDARQRAELGVLQMPGGKSVFPTLTVDECLRLAGHLQRADQAAVRVATERALDLFPRLRERGDVMAGNLSGGEQQQLGLAMALIGKPRLLMIDELSLGLSPVVVARLCDVVRQINEQGTTVILVEQSVNVALTLAGRAVFMEKGQVRFSGPTADLLGRDDILRSVFLEGAAAGLGQTAAPVLAVDERARARRTTDRTSEGTEEPALRATDLQVRFGGVRAVDGVSFELYPGEILGFIGPNGAGKTTVFDAVCGYVALSGGRVHLGDVDVTTWSPDRRARFGLGRSFQDARVFPSLTVSENIAVAYERHLAVRDPFSAALGLPEVAAAEVAVGGAVGELIDLLGLGAYTNKFAGELSTGTRRIVDLAMALAHDPDVLVLDEPSSGIAQRETEALGELIRRIQREIGCALLVIEHDMPLITGIADRLIALETGRVIAEGLPSAVVADPEVVASYLGTVDATINRSTRTP